MKKILTSMFAVILVCITLTACTQSDEKFIGEWETVMTQDLDLGLEDTLAIDFVITMVVSEDGNFSITTVASDDSMTAFEKYIDDFMANNIAETVEAQGLTEEEVIALVEESIGMTIEEYKDASMLTFSESIAQESVVSGVYTIDGDTLTIGDADDSSIFAYENGKLTTTEATMGYLEFTKK